MYTIKVEEASKERRDAKHLLALLEKQVAMLEKEWKCSVIAIVTDASGESRKARKLFKAKYPHVIVLDCYAHQVHFTVLV